MKSENNGRTNTRHTTRPDSDHDTDLSLGLAGLIKAGLAYTSEIDPDGNSVYVIDRIRLREDELVMLHRKGALTQEGLRQYLVDRAA